MKKIDFTKTSRMMHKAGFAIRKQSPAILIAAGVVGVVASTVMACKATTKINDILTESKEDLDAVHAAASKPETLPEGAVYTEEDTKQDLRIVYVQTGIKFVKLYGPSAVLGTLSLASILMSHRIICKRNVALAAAYATIDKGFKEYRGRVVDRFGNQVDKELRYNIKAKTIEKNTVDENGKDKTVNEIVETAEIDKYSDYAKFFAEGNPYWEKDAEYNLMFLRKQERYANDKLKAKGYLFLSEVYEMLGIPETKASRVVGWIYDESHPIGDNYIDFGIYDTNSLAKSYFVNGHERNIILDFNVDGNIWELM